MPFAATSVVWPGTIAPVPASAAGTAPSTGVTAASTDASVDAAAEAVAASAPPAGAVDVDAELDVALPVAEDEDELDGVDELVDVGAFVVVELFADELFVDWLLLVVLADFCVVPDELLVVCVRVVGLLVVVVEQPSTSGSSPSRCCSSEPWSCRPRRPKPSASTWPGSSRSASRSASASSGRRPRPDRR